MLACDDIAIVDDLLLPYPGHYDDSNLDKWIGMAFLAGGSST
jgi:hypothetical protein